MEDAKGLGSHRARDLVSRIVPKRVDEGELVNTSFRLGKKLLDELDAVAEATGNSRTEVIVHMLRWALAEWKAEMAESETKRGGKK